MFVRATLLLAAFLMPTGMALADASKQEAAQAVRLVSGWRAAHGLPPVTIDANLSRVADIQTRAMMAQGTVSHDAAGDFRTRMRSNGVRGTAAENLAGGAPGIEQVMTMWQGSSGHNANLLNPEIARVGISKGVTATGYVYWTMVFAGR